MGLGIYFICPICFDLEVYLPIFETWENLDRFRKSDIIAVYIGIKALGLYDLIFRGAAEGLFLC